MDPRSRELLADLLLAWEDAFRDGNDVSAEELAREHPDLVEPLARRIRVLRATSWLDQPQGWHADSEPAEPLPLGGRILGGRYRLDDRIGVGGFAEVWKAFDVELQRVVAVKIPKRSHQPPKAAFLAEARRVARLRHPAIASVHDVGTDGDGRCFIVSEYMEGGSLADRLAQGPVHLEQAARWIASIAEALDFAHRNGIVHRDVKPANILINHHDDAVLADFGIAQSATKSGEFAPSLGTLRSMAPEQLEQGEVGPAADVYSLGVVLHEAVTGSPLWPSATPELIRRRIRDAGEPRLSDRLPRGLAEVCRKALRRDPRRRHASAADFAAHLRRSTKADWMPRRISSRKGFVALVAIAIALLASVPWWIDVSRRKVEIAGAFGARARPPALSPSGSPPTAPLRFTSIEDALPYAVAIDNVRLYREWQQPPISYLGPKDSGAEAQIVFRFDFTEPTTGGRLVGSSFCTDFTREPGGEGRGAAALDVSRDGSNWLALRDDVTPRAWSGDWRVDERLPTTVIGGTSVWVRVRMISESCPNLAYTVAQFGRAPHPPGGEALSLTAEFAMPP